MLRMSFGRNYLKIFKMKYYMEVRILKGSLISWIIFMMALLVGGANGNWKNLEILKLVNPAKEID